MIRFFKTLIVVASVLVGGVSVANADDYLGGWQYDSYGYETMILGDGDGSGLYLTGTDRYCGRPGAGYRTMHRILDNTGGGFIHWWVDQGCSDGFVRVCIENQYGQQACSTYYDDGWGDF